MTGVSNRSLTSNAATMRSWQSWLSAGSRHGTRANLANWRLSCSFDEEWAAGSSADTMTSPASTPVMATEKNASEATLSPTCFIVARARRPAYAAPIATSRPTFSLGDHSAYTSG